MVAQRKRISTPWTEMGSKLAHAAPTEDPPQPADCVTWRGRKTASSVGPTTGVPGSPINSDRPERRKGPGSDKRIATAAEP